MTVPELVLQFPDRAALQLEHTRNLAHGRALVPGVYDLSVFSACLLTLRIAGSQAALHIPCEVVMVMEEGEAAVALQFRDRGPEQLMQLAAFVTHDDECDFEESAPTGKFSSVPARLDDSQPASDMPPATSEAPPDYDDSDEDEDQDTQSQSTAAQRAIVEARALKLRNLTPPQRMQVARSSVLEERVLLERIYGSAVWELLLRNPKITVPEVARMARKGTMPRPLLDLIAENEQWIRHSLVRRALLANPRLSTDALTRVLRTLPPRELKLVPQQTAYPANVRQAATRLMRGG